jgi:hypothetical protein
MRKKNTMEEISEKNSLLNMERIREINEILNVLPANMKQSGNYVDYFPKNDGVVVVGFIIPEPK